MEKEKAPFLGSVIRCFNPNFYPAVLRQSGWRSLLYLGFICAIVYGVLSYRLANVSFDLVEEMVTDFYDRALPDFYFQNGQADYPPDKPYIYEEKEGERVYAVVVDTSGETKELGEKYREGLLITKTEIVTKSSQGKKQGEKYAEARQAIPKRPEKVAAKDFFLELVRSRRPRVVMGTTFNEYLRHVVAKVILVSLASAVFLFADKGKRQEYPFGYYFNVGCYAVTPFVLSAFARGGQTGTVGTYASYGVSLTLFLALAVAGLAKCRQEDARELQSSGEQEGAEESQAGQ